MHVGGNKGKRKRANLFSGQLSGLTKKVTGCFEKTTQEPNSLQQGQGGSFLKVALFLIKNLQCSQQSITSNSYSNRKKITLKVVVIRTIKMWFVVSMWGFGGEGWGFLVGF